MVANPSPDALVQARKRGSHVARSWALLRVHLAKNKRRLNVNDLWIAATALPHDIPVVTQDDDFGPVDTVAGLSVRHV